MPEVNNMEPLLHLQTEMPAGRLAQMRQAWPHIKAALDLGHTLKVVHERFLACGQVIPYSTFVRYVHSLRNKEVQRSRPVRQSKAVSPTTAPKGGPRPIAEEPDPFAMAMAALNQPKYDIREPMNDGDPTGRNLI
jgi:hypothetical protein